MIFLANVLVMNGGSTFLIRTCNEIKRQEKPVAVLLLRRKINAKLLEKLENSAEVFYLEDFLLDKGFIFRAHLGIFGLVNWSRLETALKPFGDHIHAMGLFGLIFGKRLCDVKDNFRLSVGIYHQNEYIFQGIDSFFAKKASDIFRSLLPKQVIFFNEFSRDNYSKFFSKDFSTSLVLPIGIDLPEKTIDCFNPSSSRIISIGNLVEFKTYNMHVIHALPKLLEIYPEIKYDIYGEGPNKNKLKDIVNELGLTKVVRFQGEIEYSEMKSVLQDSSLFIGSGTALLEAAALGIPAIIGIESIPEPLTYGYISEIQGLSYNENVPYVTKVAFITLLTSFFGNIKLRENLSIRCREKSETFSVKKTVAGLLELKLTNTHHKKRVIQLQLPKMFFSFLHLALKQMINRDSSFSSRRNQSF